jgi:hypothetical protein
MNYRKLQRISTHALFAHDVPLCPNVLCLHYDQVDLEHDWRTESYRCRECGFITSMTEVVFLQKAYEHSRPPGEKEARKPRKEKKADYYRRVQQAEHDYNLKKMSSVAPSSS